MIFLPVSLTEESIFSNTYPKPNNTGFMLCGVENLLVFRVVTDVVAAIISGTRLYQDSAVSVCILSPASKPDSSGSRMGIVFSHPELKTPEKVSY
jgi:hypothetical protein